MNVYFSAKPLSCIFLLLLVLQLFSCSSADKNFSESEWRQKVDSEDGSLVYAPHVNDKKYFNPWLKDERKSIFFAFLRWRLSSKGKYTESEEEYLPAFIPDAKSRIQDVPGRDFILWIGHSSFLLRVSGEYWLVDPIFSERVILPKRKTRPGISIEDLNEVAKDLNVIITHNHHDHLDKDSIVKLRRGAKFYVPIGIKDYIEKWDIGPVFEMDWWQSTDVAGNSKLVCLPSQHWSNRLDQDRNASLWASYMLVTPSVTIYFGGDSGYFVGYKEIQKKFPAIDYAVLPIGASRPRWFMHRHHINPEEAIDAFKDLGAKYFIPCHWGTFQLGEEPAGYPSIDLKRNIKEMKLDESRFKIMDIGEILIIDHK